MKNKTLLKIGWMCLASLATGLFCPSCNRGAEMDANPSILPGMTGEAQKTYAPINGTLHFKSLRDARGLGKQMDRMPYAQFVEWEQQTGFQSLKTRFHQSVDEMDTAKTLAGLKRVLDQHKDILYITDSMVSMDFNPCYAAVCNRNGFFNVGDYLVKTGKDYMLMVKGGKPEDMDQYTHSDESYRENGVIFDKYKNFGKIVTETSGGPNLKTGYYCGYGWYGPEIKKFCENSQLNRMIELFIRVKVFETTFDEYPCDVCREYEYTTYAAAYKKFPVFGYIPYNTSIWIQNFKFGLIYPYPLANSVQCESENCPGQTVDCQDWDCRTLDTTITLLFDNNTSYLSDAKAFEAVKNPISPEMINKDPLFLKVRANASHQEMGGINAVINYGYSGTQGKYCQQQ